MNSFQNKRKIISKRYELIPARLVLYLLVLNGITVTFLMRIVINLTILAMVKQNPLDENVVNITETLCTVEYNNTYPESIDYGGTLDWSTNDQYYVLSSFYWTYILTQVPGGILTQKYGTKRVFGWSLLTASICTVCIPFTSNIHYVIVVILQSIHGFVQGCVWPALYAVIGVWIPTNERSRFVTSFQGLALGTVLGNLSSGFIIAKFGWVYVFYFTGGIGLFSTLVWYLLMHNTPEQHPRISEQELHYIQENREKSLYSQKIIPWRSILMSTSVLAIGVSSFGRMWLYSVILIYGPLYLKTIIGLTVEKNGLMMGLPWFASFLTTLFYSFVSDKVVTHKLMPLVYNRKMFTGISQIIPGLMVISMSYINCNIFLINAIWFLLPSIMSAALSGAMSNIVDISPNYTAPVTSVIQIIMLLPTIFSTLLVKTLLQNENSLETWRKIFNISSGVIMGTYIFYAIFASGKVQPWDIAERSKKSLTDKTEEELLNDDEVKLTV